MLGLCHHLSCPYRSKMGSGHSAAHPVLRWLRARQTPLSALVLISVAAISIGACAVVVVASDGRTIESWPVPPAVTLAVLSSIINFSLGFALSVGVVIRWWRSAYRGTTLRRLHLIWSRGLSLDFGRAVAGSGPSTRNVVLAAACIGAVKFVNNPLLQRSVTAQTRDVVTNETMLFQIATHIPDGWAGTVRNYTAFDPTQDFSGPVPAVLSGSSLYMKQRWWQNATMTSNGLPGYTCDGTCRGWVEAAGFSCTCESTETTLNVTAPENNGSSLFFMDLTRHENASYAPYLLYRVAYVSDITNSCIATLVHEACEIQSAVVKYPVVIQNSTIALDYARFPDMRVVSTYIASGDRSKPGPEYLPAGPLTALQFQFDDYLWSNSTLAIDRTSDGVPSYRGIGFPVDFFYETQKAAYAANSLALQKCPLLWQRPTNYFVNAMREYMFRAARQIGTGAFTGNAASKRAANASLGEPQNFTETQTFVVERTVQALIFQSNYNYLVRCLLVWKY